jgi:hypothetical protein
MKFSMTGQEKGDPLIQVKTTDLPYITDKLSHNVVSSTPHNEWDTNSKR